MSNKYRALALTVAAGPMLAVAACQDLTGPETDLAGSAISSLMPQGAADLVNAEAKAYLIRSIEQQLATLDAKGGNPPSRDDIAAAELMRLRERLARMMEQTPALTTSDDVQFNSATSSIFQSGAVLHNMYSEVTSSSYYLRHEHDADIGGTHYSTTRRSNGPAWAFSSNMQLDCSGQNEGETIQAYGHHVVEIPWQIDPDADSTASGQCSMEPERPIKR